MIKTTYVIGHRNPDTDSIASAIGYAALQAAARRQYRHRGHGRRAQPPDPLYPRPPRDS